MQLLQPATVVIACPHCGTRYQVPPETLGSRGRQVSCAHCGKAWLAEARHGTDLGPLRAWVAATPFPVLPVQGRDGLALGIPPGPALGRLLAAVRAWWLAQGCAPGREECLVELRRLAAAAPAC